MKKIHHSAEVFLRGSEKDIFQIASDIKDALADLKKELGSEDHRDPQCTLVPDVRKKRLLVAFELNEVKRLLTVEPDNEDAPDDVHKLRLSLGAWGQAREILTACAEKITPSHGFFYSNPREFPQPVMVFAES